jgi:hypothetical protein
LTKGRTSYDLERRIARIFRVVWSSGGLPAVGHRRARFDGSEIAAEKLAGRRACVDRGNLND